MTELAAGNGPVYRLLLKDFDGFPTVVIAGPNRRRTWLYVHGPTPTVLRLHWPVVRFLRDALGELGTWLDRSEAERGALVCGLPWHETYPECVLIASGRRAWLHVFSATPSVVRLHRRAVRFLQEALADLPATDTGERAVGESTDVDPVHIRGPIGEVVAR